MNRNLILGILVLFLFACGREKGFLYQTAKKVPVKIQLHRFDKDLYAQLMADTLDFTFLQKKYPMFLPIYCEHILSLPSEKNLSFNLSLKKWFKQKDIQTIYQSVNDNYSDISELQTAVNGAFSNLYSYIANKNLPEIFLYVSGLNQSVVSNRHLIAVSLDKYLGEDYSFYQNYFYQYELKTMSSNYIPKDIITAWYFSTYNNIDIEELLDGMIYYGKLYYLLSKVFPEENEAALFNFSKSDFIKINKTKSKLWTYLVKNKLLNNRDKLFVSKMLGNESFLLFGLGTLPGKTGAWLGYHIIKNYVEKNGPLSLSHLLYNHNSQLILKKSTYHPNQLF